MGLCRNAGVQCHLDSRQDGLFIVMEDEGQYLHHLPVAAGMFKDVLLQSFERIGQFDEWRTIAQCTGLALDDGQIMPLVINRVPRTMV